MDHLTVRDIMSTDLISIDRHLKVNQALELMHSQQVRRLPVVEPGDRLVGIITEKDAQLAVAKASAVELAAADPWSATPTPPLPTVQDVMTHYVHTIAPGRSVAHAAELLSSHRISGLPVVDGGRLIGIVTAYDVYRLVVEQMRKPQQRRSRVAA